MDSGSLCTVHADNEKTTRHFSYQMGSITRCISTLFLPRVRAGFFLNQRKNGSSSTQQHHLRQSAGRLLNC